MAYVTDIWFGSGTIRREWPYVILGEELHLLYEIKGDDFAIWNEVFAPYKNVYIKRADTASPEVYDMNGGYLGGIEPLNIMMKTQPVVGLYIDGNLSALQYHQNGGKYYFAFTIDKPGTHTIQLATNEGVSKALYVEAIEGFDVPLGKVGISAIILQDWNNVIEFDSRITDEEQQENVMALFPIICVENNVKANRQVGLEFYWADENGNLYDDKPFGTWVVRSIVNGEPSMVLHEFDRVFINFASDEYVHHARAIFDIYPKFSRSGKFKLGVKPKVHIFFENEKPEEEVHQMEFVDFEMVDIAPKAGNLTVKSIYLEPNEPGVENTINVVLRNDQNERIWMEGLSKYMLMVDGKYFVDGNYVDWATTSMSLDPGKEHTLSWRGFIPEEGKSHTICFMDDGQTVTYTDEDGSRKTDKNIKYERPYWGV